MSGKRGGQLNKPRIMFAQNPHENALGKLKRRPKLDKVSIDRQYPSTNTLCIIVMCVIICFYNSILATKL